MQSKSPGRESIDPPITVIETFMRNGGSIVLKSILDWRRTQSAERASERWVIWISFADQNSEIKVLTLLNGTVADSLITKN
jgi:hypothetical protein